MKLEVLAIRRQPHGAFTAKAEPFVADIPDPRWLVQEPEHERGIAGGEPANAQSVGLRDVHR
jgi:hypothetical protein